ncbi:MAG: fructosamine kinase family protein [Rhodospirillaceae bacterium]|nr:fructosamine kinase family protein [Rhodospirillaceae bacterium]
MDIAAVARHTAAALGVRVTAAVALEGGSTGTVARCDLIDGSRVVAKLHGGSGAPPAAEAAQLEAIRATGAFPVPAVLHAGDRLLVLEWIETDDPRHPWSPAIAAEAGARLAHLHRTTGPACGFADQTWIGRVPQPNPWTRRWSVFFARQRLGPLVDACRAAGRLPAELAGRLAGFAAALPERLPEQLAEPACPVLLHGDLWPGNLLVRGGRIVGLVDPALHYGHPALDLATPGAYGTVPADFAAAYRLAGGLWPGDGVLATHRLWPLLVNLLYWDAGLVDRVAATLAAAIDGPPAMS